MLIQRARLSVHADCTLVTAGDHTQRFLEWVITAPRAPLVQTRAPLNLALILDRSGSMSGAKLDYVRKAALHVLDLLDERDQLAVIAYDNHVHVLGESRPVTGEHRQALRREIERLRTGGSTDLGQGWLHGAAQVADNPLPNGINRALLLTDGLANCGITSIDELAGHARELRQRGVTTSTFGVGLDFNEHLLAPMAEQGGGHYYYIEDPASIPGVFREELGELLTVTVRDAALVVSGPDSAAVELLGGLAFDYDGHSLRLPLGALHSEQELRLYMRVLTLTGQAGAKLPITGRLTYVDLSGDRHELEARVTFEFADRQAVDRAPVNEGVRGRAAEIGLSTVATLALKQERQGQYAEAAALLREALNAYAGSADASVADEYARLAQDIGTGEMSPMMSKRLHSVQNRKQKTRR